MKKMTPFSDYLVKKITESMFKSKCCHKYQNILESVLKHKEISKLQSCSAVDRNSSNFNLIAFKTAKNSMEYNPIALRKTKIICNFDFGLYECSRVNFAILSAIGLRLVLILSKLFRKPFIFYCCESQISSYTLYMFFFFFWGGGWGGGGGGLCEGAG